MATWCGGCFFSREREREGESRGEKGGDNLPGVGEEGDWWRETTVAREDKVCSENGRRPALLMKLQDDMYQRTVCMYHFQSDHLSHVASCVCVQKQWTVITSKSTETTVCVCAKHCAVKVNTKWSQASFRLLFPRYLFYSNKRINCIAFSLFSLASPEQIEHASTRIQWSEETLLPDSFELHHQS